MRKEFIIKHLPTAFCHAASIIRLANENLFCCWFGGQREGTQDVAIWYSRNNAHGWTEPVQAADGPEANWNPVLFAAGEDLLLFYKEGQQIADWRTYLRRWLPEDSCWSKPEELMPGDCSGGRGPVRNKPVLLSSGRIIAGGSTERGLWKAFADYSDDNGRTWHKAEPVAIEGLQYRRGEKTAESTIAVSEQSFYGRGVIQPSLWESAASKVHMLLRSSEGRIYRSDSSDYGCKWSEAYPTEMPNNNSGLDLVKAPFDDCLYLVCNPVASNWGMRSPLSLFKSADNGVSWKKVLDLETAPGEFSYPAIIADKEGLDIAYTWQRKNIVHCRLNAKELENGQ